MPMLPGSRRYSAETDLCQPVTSRDLRKPEDSGDLTLSFSETSRA